MLNEKGKNICLRLFLKKMRSDYFKASLCLSLPLPAVRLHDSISEEGFHYLIFDLWVAFFSPFLPPPCLYFFFFSFSAQLYCCNFPSSSSLSPGASFSTTPFLQVLTTSVSSWLPFFLSLYPHSLHSSSSSSLLIPSSFPRQFPHYITVPPPSSPPPSLRLPL